MFQERIRVFVAARTAVATCNAYTEPLHDVREPGGDRVAPLGAGVLARVISVAGASQH